MKTVAQMTFQYRPAQSRSEGNIVRLEKADLLTLLETGCCRPDIDEPERLIEGGLTLFYSDEGIKDFFFDDRPKFIQGILSNSIVGSYQQEECTISDHVLFQEQLLAGEHEVTFPTVEEYRAAVQNKKEEFNAPWSPRFLPKTEFLDLVSYCDCGEPLCYSEFAWVKESRCLLLFAFEEDHIFKVKTFPFTLEHRVAP